MDRKLVVLVILALVLLQGCIKQQLKKDSHAMIEEENVEELNRPNVNIRFLFNVCNDIDEVRHFYTDLLGMKEVAYMNDENFGYLSYQCEGEVYFMFFRADAEIPVLKEWACQPGWAGGTLETYSWGMEVPEDMFAEVYDKLKKEGVPMFKPEPDWRQDSYWGLSVMDPMGNTIEIYSAPKMRPESTIWSGEQ